MDWYWVVYKRKLGGKWYVFRRGYNERDYKDLVLKLAEKGKIKILEVYVGDINQIIQLAILRDLNLYNKHAKEILEKMKRIK